MDQLIELPSHFPRRLVAYLVDRKGVPFTAILDAVDLPPTTILQPHSLIDQERYQSLVRYGIRCAEAEVLGLEFGESLHLSDLGVLGYAASAQPSIRDAINLFVDHYDGISRLTRLAVEGDRDLFLRIVLEPDLPGYMERFLVQSLVSAIVHNVLRLGAGQKPPMIAHFNYARPSQMAAYHRLPSECLFDCSQPGVFMPDQLLGERLTDDYLRNWPEEMGLEGNEGAHRNRNCSLDVALGELLRASFPEVPSLEVAARRLGLSLRQLQRSLSHQKTTYRAMVSSIRMEEGARLLTQTGIPVSEVAAQLGFSDVASFSRAFRRSFGLTPRDYRSRGPA